MKNDTLLQTCSVASAEFCLTTNAERESNSRLRLSSRVHNIKYFLHYTYLIRIIFHSRVSATISDTACTQHQNPNHEEGKKTLIAPTQRETNWRLRERRTEESAESYSSGLELVTFQLIFHLIFQSAASTYITSHQTAMKSSWKRHIYTNIRQRS